MKNSSSPPVRRRRKEDPIPIPAKPARVPDVARLAGVSTATVDRVLNHRSGVRPVTSQRVLKAAAELGYLPEADWQAATQAAPLRLTFLLPRGTNRFIRMLGDFVDYSKEQFTPFNVKCRCEFIEAFNPQVLAASLLRHGRRVDGVAFLAIEHPLVREAVNTLAARGVPTVTLISDLPGSQRAAYVGLDNFAAGRTAGYLLARFAGTQTGKLALIAGSRSYRAHGEREKGFLQIIKERFPAMQVVGLREGHDDVEQNFRQTSALLRQYPDLVGIYNIGGASEGVGRALKEAGREHKVVFIGHGLTPDTRALMIDGTMDAVITQTPQMAITNCIRIFTNLRDQREPMLGVEAVSSTVVLRENLPY
jgi:LacI family transcriptional regulator